MKNKRIRSLFTFLLAFSLMGCGKNNTDGGSTSNGSQPENNKQGLAFYLQDDDTYAVGCGYATMLSNIVVPSSYNGRAVTKVMDGGFATCFKLKSITLPETITELGVGSFLGSSALASINIPSKVKQIPENCFSECAFSTIELPAELEEIGVGSFCKSALVSIEIPNSVTTIGSGAFSRCRLLKDVTIPNSIISVGRDAFFDCESLVYTEYNNGLYLGNTSNAHFYLKDPKDNTVTSFTVYDGCKIIGSNVINSLGNLENLTIPDSVISLGENTIHSTAIIYNEYENGYYIGNATNPYVCLFKTKENYDVWRLRINDRCKIICYGAIYDIHDLCQIIVPNSVISVEVGSIYSPRNIFELVNKSSLNLADWFSTDKNIKVISNESESKITVSGNFVTYIDANEVSLLSYIGDNAEVETPANITRIDTNAFYKRNFITSVKLNVGLKTISRLAFWIPDLANDCEIYLPSSILSIEDQAFFVYYGKMHFFCEPESCPSSWRFDYEVLEWCIWGYRGRIVTDDYEFWLISNNGVVSATVVDYNKSLAVFNPPSIINGYPVTNIGYVFNLPEYLDNVTTAILPDGITKIQTNLFKNMRKMTSVTIPTSVVEIESRAFVNCIFTSIVIPKEVEVIGNFAFNNCATSLTIYCEAESKPEGWANGWNVRGPSSTTYSVVWGYSA